MLILTRKKNEKILIGDSIVVTVVEVRVDKASIGIDAPPDVKIHRQEVHQRIAAEQVAAER